MITLDAHPEVPGLFLMLNDGGSPVGHAKLCLGVDTTPPIDSVQPVMVRIIWIKPV